MKPTEGVLIREAEVEFEGWSDPDIHSKSPIRWKLLITKHRMHSEGMTMGIGEIPARESLLLHHHEPEEVYYVLDGEGSIEIDGNAVALEAGCAVFIPGNAKHRTTNTGTTTLRFLFVFPTDSFEEVKYYYDE